MSQKSQRSTIESGQRIDDVFHKWREHPKQLACWKALENICFLDRYLNGEFSMILHMDAGLKIDAVWPETLNRDRAAMLHLAIRISSENSDDSRTWREIEQEQMLVRNIQILKNVDNMPLPSFVRLCFIENELVELGAEGIYFNAMQRRFELLSRFAGGELSEIGLSVWNEPFGRAHPSEINGAVQVVKRIPENQGQIRRAILEVWDHVHQYLATGFSIKLDCGRVTVLYRDECTFKIGDVLLGPFDLQVGVSKKCAHG
jgi:hypothetical protein